MHAASSLLVLSIASIAATSYECPSGTILPPFEVSLSWDADADLDLYVLEPGGVEVFYGQKLGDVGMMGGDVQTGGGVETYLLLNGLDPATDLVEDYFYAWVVRADAEEGTRYTLTARSKGIKIWRYTGEFAPGVYETEMYTAAMYEYYEFDCYIEDYGECPSGAFSDTGNPPCLACPSGEVSNDGSTSCTAAVLQVLGLPMNMAEAILEDAVYGFAGPGYINIDEPLNTYSVNIIEEGDAGTLHLSGSFTRNDHGVLPASTALYLYFDDGDEDTDFVRGQGEMNYNTGTFRATVTDIPPGYGRVILSFVVADPGDSPSEIVTSDTVFPVYVVNNGCSQPLTIALEWNTDNTDLDLSIVEPSGNSVYYGLKLGDVGYLDNDNTEGFGPENYIMYSGLDVAEDAVLGIYAAQVSRSSVSTDTIWTLTARIGGKVVWVEQGEFYADPTLHDSGLYSYDFGDSTSATFNSKSGIFYVSLNEYNDGDCTVPDAAGATAPPTLAGSGGFLWSSLEKEDNSESDP